jgi:hypothetical protein
MQINTDPTAWSIQITVFAAYGAPGGSQGGILPSVRSLKLLHAQTHSKLSPWKPSPTNVAQNSPFVSPGESDTWLLEDCPEVLQCTPSTAFTAQSLHQNETVRHPPGCISSKQQLCLRPCAPPPSQDVSDIRLLENGRMNLSLERANIAERVASVLSTLAPQLDARKVTVRSEVDPVLKDRVYLTDGHRVEQVKTNPVQSSVTDTDAPLKVPGRKSPPIRSCCPRVCG